MMLGKLLKKMEPAKRSSGTGPSEEASLREEAVEAEGADLVEIAGAACRSVASDPPAPEPPEPEQESSLIGTGTYLRGTLACPGGLVLHGGFAGTVFAPSGAVRIGPEADVQADIEAIDLQVEGKIRGSLSARDSLELRKGADVQGSIRCLRLQIGEEAVFRGSCECFRPVPHKLQITLRWPDLSGFFTAARVAAVRL